MSVGKNLTTCGLWLVVLIDGACGDRWSPPVTDPIPGVPGTQQRAVTKRDFGLDWPFEPETGTLGCIERAVVFRTSGTNYAVNDAAGTRGYPAVEPIVRWQTSRWPTNPFPGITQDERKKVFAESMRCRQQGYPQGCRRRLLETRKLADKDLQQIEAEGHERLWPPSPPRRQSVDVLIDAGLKLCR